MCACVITLLIIRQFTGRRIRTKIRTDKFFKGK